MNLVLSAEICRLKNATGMICGIAFMGLGVSNLPEGGRVLPSFPLY